MRKPPFLFVYYVGPCGWQQNIALTLGHWRSGQVSRGNSGFCARQLERPSRKYFKFSRTWASAEACAGYGGMRVHITPVKFLSNQRLGASPACEVGVDAIAEAVGTEYAQFGRVRPSRSAQKQRGAPAGLRYARRSLGRRPNFFLKAVVRWAGSL
jgi:hypothetical protein